MIASLDILSVEQKYPDIHKQPASSYGMLEMLIHLLFKILSYLGENF